jgi:hypothetical protein
MSGFGNGCFPPPCFTPSPLPGSLTLAQLTQFYNAALLAYNQLMTGQQVVNFTDQNGERVQYSQANAANLKTYIQDLAGQITAMLSPQCASRPGPIGFIF